jgi:tRNA(Ile)-lysidine synthase TilS/MesJ
MSLLRGTGAAGVRGLAVSRRLAGRGDETIRLIRPMASEWCGVAIDRAVCQRLCRDSGAVWCEDATNADTTRLRNAVRAEVIPVLRRLRPDVLTRAAAASGHARAVDQLLRQEASRILQQGVEREVSRAFDRDTLRAEPLVSLGSWIRAQRQAICGDRMADRVSKRTVDAIMRAIRDRSTDPREFVIGGMAVRVTAREVCVRGMRE